MRLIVLILPSRLLRINRADDEHTWAHTDRMNFKTNDNKCASVWSVKYRNAKPNMRAVLGVAFSYSYSRAFDQELSVREPII